MLAHKPSVSHGEPAQGSSRNFLSNVPNFGVPTPAYESGSRQLIHHKTTSDVCPTTDWVPPFGGVESTSAAS
jgi:hypothetical protein